MARDRRERRTPPAAGTPGGWETTNGRAHRWPQLAATVVVAAAAAVAAAALAGGGGPPEAIPVAPAPSSAPTASPHPSPDPVLPSPQASAARSVEPWPVAFGDTGTALVFDDGNHGAVAVDLDTGAATRVRLPGQRPGDQPYRLWRLGDRLVVGWGEIWTVALGRDAPSRLLADATLFLPAAAPDRLWLVDTRDPGAVRWVLVDAAGTVLAAVDRPDAGLEPLRGVPGGLAVRRADGTLGVYDLAAGRVVDYLGEEPAWLADATAELVAWCPEPCAELRVSDAAGEVVTALALEHAQRYEQGAAWLSPDGRRVAAVVWSVPDSRVGVGRELRVHAVGDGTLLARGALPLGPVRGAWSADGAQFFHAVEPSPGAEGAPQQLGRWTAEGGVQRADMAPRLAGLGDFVALPRDAVAGLFVGRGARHGNDEW